MADNKEEKKKEKPIPRGADVISLKDAMNKYLGSDVCRAGEEIGVSVDTSYLYPTGILSLDKYLGVGGLLGGRIVNAWGWEGTGKTLTALTIAGFIQKQKFIPCVGNVNGEGRVAFLDAEATYSPTMAASVGVDPSKVLLFQSTPEKILTGEDYFDIIKILIQNGIELIIVDSLPALVPSSRMTATIGQGQKATSAVLIAEGLQTITPLLNGFKRSIVWMINQKRMKPMVMFGPTEGHTGGEAIKFFESYSIEVKKKADIIKKVPSKTGQFEEQRIGVTVEAKLHKNKTAAIPVDPIQYDIYFKDVTDDSGQIYHTGVDVYKDIVQVAIATGVINKSSSWYSYGDLRTNGEDAFISALRAADPTVLAKIRSEVLNGK
jgi:recombination protein RecA